MKKEVIILSERLKAKLGEELYKQVLEKVKAEEVDLTEGLVEKSKVKEVETKLEEANNNLSNLQSKFDRTEKQLKDTEDILSENKGLKEKYDSMDKKYKEDLEIQNTKYQKEISDAKKKYLIENLLTKEGAKHTKLLMNTIDFDKISIEGENLLGFSDILNNMKTGEYKDLFIQQRNEPGNTSNQSNTNNQSNDTLLGNSNLSNDDRTEGQWLESFKDL